MKISSELFVCVRISTTFRWKGCDSRDMHSSTCTAWKRCEPKSPSPSLTRGVCVGVSNETRLFTWSIHHSLIIGLTGFSSHLLLIWNVIRPCLCVASDAKAQYLCRSWWQSHIINFMKLRATMWISVRFGIPFLPPLHRIVFFSPYLSYSRVISTHFSRITYVYIRNSINISA